MAKLLKTALHERLREDIAKAGGTSLVISSGRSPMDLVITIDDQTATVRIYMWNLSHDRTRDDFKFQITAVPGGAFVFDPDVRTVILGYYETSGLYLAADAYLRRRSLSKSPAIQARQAQLDVACRDGIHAFAKANSHEIAIVVKSDLIATYLVESELLHDMGSTPRGLRRLNQIASTIGSPASSPTLMPRDKREAKVLRSLRDRNFAKLVLAAYDYQCCVCEVQLDLPQAAHIVPVKASLSSDDVRNGVALCPLHHFAYDVGLIRIMPNYGVKVSDRRVAQLAAAARDGGLNDFKRGLRSKILVPLARASRPDEDLLRLGLRARKW